MYFYSSKVLTANNGDCAPLSNSKSPLQGKALAIPLAYFSQLKAIAIHLKN